MKIENKGGVYFIKNSYNNQVKIGCSNDVSKRFEVLKSEMYHLGFDFTLTFLGAIYDEKYYMIENHLHNKYKDKRKIGEWFEISEQEAIDCIVNFDQDKINQLIENNSCTVIEFNEISSDEYMVILGNKVYKDGILNLAKCQLNLNEKGILYSIFELSNFDNSLQIKMSEISSYISLTERNLRKYMKKFCDLGILKYDNFYGTLHIHINDKILRKYDKEGVEI